MDYRASISKVNILIQSNLYPNPMLFGSHETFVHRGWKTKTIWEREREREKQKRKGKARDNSPMKAESMEEETIVFLSFLSPPQIFSLSSFWFNGPMLTLHPLTMLSPFPLLSCPLALTSVQVIISCLKDCNFSPSFQRCPHPVHSLHCRQSELSKAENWPFLWPFKSVSSSFT